jgi:catechol 2,3-dioxygenase-like lactoylglutathione lyase family enzyme
MKTRLLAWAGPNGSVTLRPAKGESAGTAHDRNAPGLNHVAFNAANREEVEHFHQLLKEIGARILDAPADYPYFPGYYAVYFTDPDGLKFEYVFWPPS